MTSSDFAQRLGEWAGAIIEELEKLAAAGSRPARLGAVGPVRVRHTYSLGSSHAALLDSLTGAPPHGASEVTVHSVQFDVDAETVAIPQFQRLPWSMSDFDGQGRPLGLDDSPWRLMWNAAGREVRCYNREAQVGLFLTAGPVRSWEYSSPMLPFWHWAAAAEGAVMVHGGTIGSATVMGIVGGPSGTGKSTTVLLGMHAGLHSCGDDYVWLQPGPSATRIWTVFRTIKTVAGSSLVPLRSDSTREEGEVRKQIHWVPVSDSQDAEALLTSAELRIAWVLREPTHSMRPPTRIDALSALLPSTLLRVNGDHAAVTKTLKGVLDAVEVRPILRNGEWDAVVDALLRDVGSPQQATTYGLVGALGSDSPSGQARQP